MAGRPWFQGVDRVLLVTTLALLGIGMLALYSASYQKVQATGVSYLARQLAWMGLGITVALFLVAVDYHRWLEWGYLLYFLNLILLGLVLELGVVRGGAQRWLTLGGWTIQPSEFAKITTVLALARFLGSRRGSMEPRWATVIGAGILFLLPAVLIFLEPNLGTASVFALMALSMLVVWGIPPRAVAGVLGMAVLVLPVGWHFLADYQRSRLMVFLNPNLDPLGAGYTVIQSKIAVGSGGLWGKGWLAGTQNQLNFLPERHTDFIFSVIGEEWGILGTTLCLALFALLFHRMLTIAIQTRDPFGRLLVVGLVTMLATHAVINAGMTLGLAPVVGLPLPLVSYGGSWMVTCLAAVGMALSVSLRRP